MQVLLPVLWCLMSGAEAGRRRPPKRPLDADLVSYGNGGSASDDCPPHKRPCSGIAPTIVGGGDEASGLVSSLDDPMSCSEGGDSMETHFGSTDDDDLAPSPRRGDAIRGEGRYHLSGWDHPISLVHGGVGQRLAHIVPPPLQGEEIRFRREALCVMLPPSGLHAKRNDLL